jgi:Carboxypeptidase regulatory-like domain
MNRFRFLPALAVLVILFAVGMSCSAQGNTATVTGIVTDSSGAVIPKTRVVITNVGTNISHEAETSNAGEYTIPLLTPGEYRVKVDVQGFKAVVQSGVTLQVAQTARLDFKLEPGQLSQTVEVTGEPPLVQADTSSTGAVIENKQVQELPLNGRQYYSLAYLTPGTSKPVQGSALSFRGGFNVSGSSETSNNYTLDGFDNNDPAINDPTYLPSIDQIQEFKLLTGVYSAEYGTNSGGQLLVTTKSGTNAFHGTAFDYFRNQIFDAKNYFIGAQQKPSFQRSQFGGTIGGPIIRDKTFFFFSYEGLRLHQQISALATVPTPAMVGGNFIGFPQLKNPFTGAPIPGNIITPGMMNSVGKALAALYPTPTYAMVQGVQPASNYSFNENRTENMDEFGLRVDHQINSTNSLFAIANRYNDPSFEPSNSLCSSRVLPGFGCTVGVTGYLAGVAYTHVFSTALVNQAHISWNQYNQPRTQQDVTNNFVANNNIPGTFLGGVLPLNTGVPVTAVTGFSTLGGATNLPQNRTDDLYQAVDTVTLTKGAHTIHLGVDYRRFLFSLFYLTTGRGQFNFTASSSAPTSGNAFADLLLGVPTSTARNPYAPTNHPRENSADGFAQDDWKVFTRLTLNLGLRYEYNGPITDKDNRISNFDPSTDALIIPGQGGVSNVYNAQKTNLAPRIGFALQPPHDDKTVIRGGFGIFYNNADKGNSIINLLFNPPFRSPQTFNNSSAAIITLSDPFPNTVSVGSLSTPVGTARNFKTAVIDEWSLGVQRQLSSTILLDVTYLGTKGTHLPMVYNINQPPPVPGATTAQVNTNRPIQGYGNINFTNTNANSSYNSLLTKIEKRTSHGLLFIASYTYSHSLDDASSTVQNSRNLAGEYGSSVFDVRHNFTFSPVYELPFGKGRAYLQHGLPSAIAGGWQVTGIVSLETGNPLTPIYTSNISNTLNNEDRPNVIGNPNNGPKTVAKWFNTAAYATPPSGTFGNAARGSITAPGFKDVDFAMSRVVSVVPERLKAEFRAELFNSFNHPNFQFPAIDPGSASFGKITGANDPREIEFALRLTF